MVFYHRGEIKKCETLKLDPTSVENVVIDYSVALEIIKDKLKKTKDRLKELKKNPKSALQFFFRRFTRRF